MCQETVTIDEEQKRRLRLAVLQRRMQRAWDTIEHLEQDAPLMKSVVEIKWQRFDEMEVEERALLRTGRMRRVR